MLLSWESKDWNIYEKKYGCLPITMSMKSARFMFVIMWLKKKVAKKKRKNKENNMIPQLKFLTNKFHV